MLTLAMLCDCDMMGGLSAAHRKVLQLVGKQPHTHTFRECLSCPSDAKRDQIAKELKWAYTHELRTGDGYRPANQLVMAVTLRRACPDAAHEGRLKAAMDIYHASCAPAWSSWMESRVDHTFEKSGPPQIAQQTNPTNLAQRRTTNVPPQTGEARGRKLTVQRNQRKRLATSSCC